MSRHNGQRVKGLRNQRPPTSQNRKRQKLNQELPKRESMNKAMTLVDTLRIAHHA